MFSFVLIWFVVFVFVHDSLRYTSKQTVDKGDAYTRIDFRLFVFHFRVCSFLCYFVFRVVFGKTPLSCVALR